MCLPMWFRPVHEKIVRERLTGSSALYGERLRDIVLGNEVVAAFGLFLMYWLHQGRIPHRMCRFYLLLAGAVGKRQGIAIPYPSPTPLLTPFGDPLRRGITAAAGLQGFRIPVSGAVVTPQFRILFGYLCSALYRSRFSRGVGLGAFVFHYWGRGCSCLRIRGVLL